MQGFGCGVSLRALSLLLIAGCSGFSLSACSSQREGRAPALLGLPALVTVAPDDLGDGWAVSSAADEGLDGGQLSDALEDISDGSYPNVDGVVVARNDHLVGEGYFNGFAAESQHDLRSASKSITSALVGIAVDQGQLGVMIGSRSTSPGSMRTRLCAWVVVGIPTGRFSS